MRVQNTFEVANPELPAIRVLKWSDIVASWKTPKDVHLYAEEIGITTDQLLNSYFRDKTSKLPLAEGGIGTPLSGLSGAIVDRFGSIRKFQAWVLNDPIREKSLRSLCKEWKEPEDVKIFAEMLGISISDICNTDFLSKRSSLPIEKGGIGRSLAGLRAAIRTYFGSMSNFQKWVLGGTVRHNYPQIVANWKNSEDAIEYSKSLGLSLENFLNTRYLQKTAGKPPSEGGIGYSLSGLVVAIRAHFGTFARFREWVTGNRPSPYFTKIVNDWKSPDDVKTFAQSVGLTLDDIATASRIMSLGTIIDPITGEERKLHGLIHAIPKLFCL